jgi:aminomethyltransferase
MTYENNPIELGLDRLVDWDLADDVSISMPALREIAARGVTRKMNGVELDGDPFPELNNVKWSVIDGGETIGKVTSAIFSPRLGKNLGFAWLPTERSALGTTVEVQTEWGMRGATVVEMPFVDPGKQIPVS